MKWRFVAQMKHKNNHRHAPVWYASLSALILLLTAVSTTVYAGDLERQQAKRIHDRLTGIPPTKTTLDIMEGLILSDTNPDPDKKGESAALEAMKNPAF